MERGGGGDGGGPILTGALNNSGNTPLFLQRPILTGALSNSEDILFLLQCPALLANTPLYSSMLSSPCQCFLALPTSSFNTPLRWSL